MGNTIEKVNLLVVGLGPAGCAAAESAARKGLNVLALDGKKEVGVPVQCAEFIPLPLSGYAQGQDVVQQRISGMKSVLPSGTTQKNEFAGLMIDRVRFDQALASSAQKAGAQLRLESRLLDVDLKLSQARLKYPEGERTVAFDVLVAADGPHSTVARSLGLPPLEVVQTRQYTVPLECAYSDTDIWLSDACPGGYAWLFPKNAVANLGLGMDKRFSRDLKTPLDDLHRYLVDNRMVGAQIYQRTGGAIPVGGLRETLVYRNVLFDGDAAGLTHPITGAGISAAVISGARAGQAAAERIMGNHTGALQDYEEDIRDQFDGTLQHARVRRLELARLWNDGAARKDATHRRCWVAFPEYFAA